MEFNTILIFIEINVSVGITRFVEFVGALAFKTEHNMPGTGSVASPSNSSAGSDKKSYSKLSQQ
jgi:hypothetical protein